MKSGEQAVFEAAVRTRSVPKSDKEARVILGDVQRYLRAALYPAEPGREPIEVEVLAERAGMSPRTIYRYANASLPLDTADRLLIAVDKTLDDVEVIER